VSPGGRRGSNTPGRAFRRIIADVHGQLVSGNNVISRWDTCSLAVLRFLHQTIFKLSDGIGLERQGLHIL
jgi:hypothetical protein